MFALPGSIHSPFSKGCHKLIRDGAKLVETAQDVLDELRLPRVQGAPASSPPMDDEFTADERAVIAALGHAPVAVDALAARSGLAPEGVAAALTRARARRSRRAVAGRALAAARLNEA